MNTITIKAKQNSVYIKTPHNAEFTDKAKEIGAQWVTEDKAWLFLLNDLVQADIALFNIFGLAVDCKEIWINGKTEDYAI